MIVLSRTLRRTLVETRSTTWDRLHTGIETQRGTGFKRESRPETQRGTGGSGAHGASNGNPTGNVDQPTPPADVASYRNRDPTGGIKTGEKGQESYKSAWERSWGRQGACGVNNQASAVLAGNELPFVAFSPDGHGYELVSSVRPLVPQKFSVEEELMHVKHVEVKSPHVGVMWKFGRSYQLRYRPRHLTVVQNYVVARQ
ncbi:hypothetical protein TNCV_718891 [Trichonephila clavipes]|nr:hypothetical protein TNCV_718891 [Trichonephila clavipes]